MLRFQVTWNFKWKYKPNKVLEVRFQSYFKVFNSYIKLRTCRMKVTVERVDMTSLRKMCIYDKVRGNLRILRSIQKIKFPGILYKGYTERLISY